MLDGERAPVLVRFAAAILMGSAACCSMARVEAPGRGAGAPASEAAADTERSPEPASLAEPVAEVPSSGFEAEVRPILESRCRPCHFEGGKVYDRYPFDRPETTRLLGAKLFTRIRDEQERTTIERFLESAADGP